MCMIYKIKEEEKNLKEKIWKEYMASRTLSSKRKEWEEKQGKGGEIRGSEGPSVSTPTGAGARIKVRGECERVCGGPRRDVREA